MKEITLTKGFKAIVDDNDFNTLNAFKWKVQVSKHSCYANRVDYSSGKPKIIYMHRFIKGVDDKNLVVDHKDHNGLNNTRENLRICSKSENAMNRNPLQGSTSKYLGVCRYKGRWRAGLKHDYKQYHLGDYDDERQAALAYNKKAIDLHGEFANINKI